MTTKHSQHQPKKLKSLTIRMKPELESKIEKSVDKLNLTTKLLTTSKNLFCETAIEEKCDYVLRTRKVQLSFME